VLRWEGVDVIEEHKDKGYMVTSTSMSIGTYGTVIGVWIEKGSQPNTSKVTVVTKRKIVTNIITSLTESTYQKDFAKAVKLVVAGKPLPTVLARD
jgi:predicted regulator of amino acid metabolism with ACT domain